MYFLAVKTNEHINLITTFRDYKIKMWRLNYSKKGGGLEKSWFDAITLEEIKL